jgi:hypothetical protein
MLLDIIHRPSSISWAQLSRFKLKTETESGLRNVIFLNINRTMDNVQQHNIYIYLFTVHNKMTYLKCTYT